MRQVVCEGNASVMKDQKKKKNSSAHSTSSERSFYFLFQFKPSLIAAALLPFPKKNKQKNNSFRHLEKLNYIQKKTGVVILF